MVNLILSTGNIMSTSAASHGHSTSLKSNQELLRGLRENILEAQTSTPSSHETYTTHNPSKDALYVPTLDFSASALTEPRADYDITVKLFHLHPATPSEREIHTRHALALVREELHISDADLLIVSYPHMAFDAGTADCGAALAPEPIADLLASWTAGPAVLQKESLVRRLGVAEFGTAALRAFLAAGAALDVDQINLRDCCAVPAGLLALAKDAGVELLVHSDCSNILPEGAVRELLGGKGGVLDPSTGVQGDVRPRWVVKYTAVVRDRGVVENKGYFALAEVVA